MNIVKRLEIKAFKNEKQILKQLLDVFLEEEPSKNYIYIVEELEDGRVIYIKRPTKRFNFDFEIWVEKWDGRNDKRPSHDDIIEDLKAKRQENFSAFKKLWRAIERVYQFEEADEVLTSFKLSFKKGLPLEMLLKILKWMFILEDMYYWNYKRRSKLMEELKKVFQTTLP